MLAKTSTIKVRCPFLVVARFAPGRARRSKTRCRYRGLHFCARPRYRPKGRLPAGSLRGIAFESVARVGNRKGESSRKLRSMANFCSDTHERVTQQCKYQPSVAEDTSTEQGYELSRLSGKSDHLAKSTSRAVSTAGLHCKG